MTVITNIVQVASPEGVEMEPEVSKSDRDSYATKLAEDAMEFLEVEFKKDSNDTFWKIISNLAEKKLEGAKNPALLIPMTPEQDKKFLQQTVPWGKYEGQKVSTVLKKDKESLMRMTKKMLPFQVQLCRHFLLIESQANQGENPA